MTRAEQPVFFIFGFATRITAR